MVTVANNLLTQSVKYKERNNIETMNEQQFAEWVRLLGLRIGFRESAIRKTFLVNAINKRLLVTGLADIDSYYKFLHSGEKGDFEWQQLVELLTIRETRFFRHQSSLDLVNKHAEEKLVVCNNNNEPYTYQVWSLGCSSGEEAYTLAIILDQLLDKNTADNSACSIIASDISQTAINTGRMGIYQKSQLTETSSDLLKKYFTELPDERYQISSEIQSQVVFTNANVLEIEKNCIGLMDIVYCQNLLIYFEHEVRINILDKLAQYLLPGGLIVLGAGEIYNWNNPDMVRVKGEDILAYRRTGLNNPGSAK